jgi:hypothetical protein
MGGAVYHARVLLSNQGSSVTYQSPRSANPLGCSAQRGGTLPHPPAPVKPGNLRDPPRPIRWSPTLAQRGGTLPHPLASVKSVTPSDRLRRWAAPSDLSRSSRFPAQRGGILSHPYSLVKSHTRPEFATKRPADPHSNLLVDDLANAPLPTYDLRFPPTAPLYQRSGALSRAQAPKTSGFESD